MARIEWNDLTDARTLNAEEMAETRGGWFFYYNVFNRALNPFGWGMQNSWIQRGNMFDQQHNNFLSFLRS